MKLLNQLARLRRDVPGRMVAWRKDTLVKIISVRGQQCGIERVKKLQTSRVLPEGLPLVNKMAGVPRSALEVL